MAFGARDIIFRKTLGIQISSKRYLSSCAIYNDVTSNHECLGKVCTYNNNS